MEKYLHNIYLSSLTLLEKVRFLDNIHPEEACSGSRFYTLWLEVIGKTDKRYLETRIKWEGWEKLLDLLLSEKFTIDKKVHLPVWLEDLAEFTKASYKNSPDQKPLTHNILPFNRVLAPLVGYYFQKLAQSSDKPPCMDNQVFIDLRFMLQRELSEISSQSLLAFKEEKDIKKFKEFEDTIICNKFKDFFERFPVLARLIFTRSHFWLTNNQKFLRRLSKDYRSIINTFGLSNTSIVSRVRAGISDTHRNGKCVYVVEFNSGEKIVYKPRNLSTDLLFNNVVKLLSQNSMSVTGLANATLIREHYGWVKYVQHLPITNWKQAKVFYKNAGYALCILNILRTTDCHSENMIACAEWPMFVDLETLLNPTIGNSQKYLNQLSEDLDKQMDVSVLRTGILPQWLLTPEGNVYDNSALGNTSATDSRSPTLVWSNIDTDDINCRYIVKKNRLNENVLLINNVVVSPFNYKDFVVAGFSECYRALLLNPKLVNRLKMLIRRSGKIKLRFVFRATNIYETLLKSLLHPDFLSNGLTRSLNLDYLSLSFLINLNTRHKYWGVLNFEYMELENGDIPYFYTYGYNHDLYCQNKVVLKKCFKKTPIDQVLERLSKLSSLDLDEQLTQINNSLQIKSGNEELYTKRHLIKSKVIVKKQEVLNVAIELGDTVVKNRYLSKDGRCTWTGYITNVVSHTYGYKPIGLDLSNGNIGVALFLAALYTMTGKEDYKDTCYKALLPVLDVLKYDWSKNEFLGMFGLGITIGVGSLIYALHKINDYIPDFNLVPSIKELASLINRESVSKTIRHDVVSGTAGALLALISLEDSFSRESNINTDINYLADCLVNNAVYEAGKLVGWKYSDGKYLLGFSHGSSGILYALAEYYKAHKNVKVRTTINDILAMEQLKFNRKAQNWPDFRYEEKNTNAVSWCHGAVGVGMSRLTLHNIQGFPQIQIRRDVERSVSKMLQGLHNLDTICCGNAGRLDYLLELKLRDLLSEKASVYMDNLISTVIRNYRDVGRFRCFQHFDTNENNYGFFQGISGIGYTMLRLIDPIFHKSVLLFK